MIRRHNSVNTSSSLSTNKKHSAGINKPTPRPFSGIKKEPQVLEDQKKNPKSQLEKFQPATKTPIKTPSTSSNLSPRQSTIPKLVRRSSTSRKLESKPSLKPPSRFTQRLLVSRKPRVLLSPEEIQQLTSKFEALSATIIRLATSSSPVNVRSLESLLAKEVTDCLGSDFNSAKFAEAFVRETRRLLYGLNCKLDESKVNSQLIKGQKGAKGPFLRPNAATTVCYRDRYLKDLVMNVLQEMCSVAEVELDASVIAVSRQRLGGAVRDLMRAEAGIEPELFQRAERGMDELQKSISHNQQEVESAFREIDKLISEHQMRQVDVPASNLAREEVKNNKKQANAKNSDSENISNKYNIMTDKSYCLKYSLLKPQSGSTKNCGEVGDEHQPVESQKTSSANLMFADQIESIRPKIDEIVKEEINRVQEKTQAILNRINEGSLSAGAESAVSDSAMCGEDTNDEINTEDSLLFLEAFKADATHVMVNSKNGSIRVPDKGVIETEQGVDQFHSTETDVKLIVNTADGCLFCDEDDTMEHAQEEALTRVESEIFSYKLYGENSMPTIAEETCDEVCASENKPDDRNTLRNVKSVWWSEESKDVQEIISQMKTALHTFDSEYSPISNQTRDVSTKSFKKGFANSYTGDLDFTVEEMARILNNISKAVYRLPIYNEKGSSYCDNTNFPMSDSQQAQIITILSLLENAFDNNSISSDIGLSTRFQFDGDDFTDRKERISRMFNMISDTLYRAPTELKKQPISAFAPPESLMKTLALLAASSFFRDCFINGILEVQRSEKDIDLLRNELEKRAGKSCRVSVGKYSRQLFSRPGIDMDIIKPVSLETQKSSADVFLGNMCPGTEKSVPHENEPNLVFKRFERKVKNCDDVNKNISRYEDYLGLATADMTVKNVSDIFVLLSTVLNNIPDRMKSEKMSSMNPPPTLLTALDILYNADEGCFTEVQKSASFNSLTIQSVSDLFLTLSKTFEDLPERVKHSRVLDLGPPKSLLNAVHLLTCLPVNADRSRQIGVEVECTNIGDYRNDDSQECFYDALDTSWNMQCEQDSGSIGF